MSYQHKLDLLNTVGLLRDQARRLRGSLNPGDVAIAEDLERIAIRMEDEARHLPDAPVRITSFDLIAHLHRQREFSRATFGPGDRLKGVVAHIRKELEEVMAAPEDAEEWADLILLALDGAWRSGHEPEDIALAIAEKQIKNESRTWPDWRTVPEGQAIEHVRGG
ncbi:hypothetical protein DLREEDagrD3_28720 [Denitratisoma sp. agr-D3]